MNAGVSRRRAGRSAALVGAKPTLAGRAVNPHLPPPRGFVDGAKRRRPQPHRVNNRNEEPTSPFVQPTQKSKETSNERHRASHWQAKPGEALIVLRSNTLATSLMIGVRRRLRIRKVSRELLCDTLNSCERHISLAVSEDGFAIQDEAALR
jgi:hypothetical protein